MKTIRSIVLFTIACSSSWILASGYDLKGTVKTVSKVKGDKIDLRRGDVTSKATEKNLEMEIRRTNPNAPESVTVRWVVLREGEHGKVFAGTTGSKEVTTKVGIPSELTSDSWVLTEMHWDADRGPGSADREMKVHGYGILVEKDGKELAAKFSPSSSEENARGFLKFADEQPAKAERAAEQRNRAPQAPVKRRFRK